MENEVVVLWRHSFGRLALSVVKTSEELLSVEPEEWRGPLTKIGQNVAIAFGIPFEDRT